MLSCVWSLVPSTNARREWVTVLASGRCKSDNKLALLEEKYETDGGMRVDEVKL